MVMIAPLLFLLSFAAGSPKNAVIACIIFFVLWLSYTIYLFRRKILKKKYKNVNVILIVPDLPQYMNCGKQSIVYKIFKKREIFR